MFALENIIDQALPGWKVVEPVSGKLSGMVFKANHPDKGDSVIRIYPRVLGEQWQSNHVNLKLLQEVSGPDGILPQLLDVVDLGDMSFLVLRFEWIPGKPLGVMGIESVPQYDLTAVHEMGLQLLKSLQSLASLGVAHCDIKPSNVILVPGTPRTVRLIDAETITRFGPLGGGLTIGSTQLGATAAYIGPELFSGTISFRTDLYSAAVVITQLLSGLSSEQLGRYRVKSAYDLDFERLCNEFDAVWAYQSWLRKALMLPTKSWFGAKRQRSSFQSVQEAVDAWTDLGIFLGLIDGGALGKAEQSGEIRSDPVLPKVKVEAIRLVDTEVPILPVPFADGMNLEHQSLAWINGQLYYWTPYNGRSVLYVLSQGAFHPVIVRPEIGRSYWIHEKGDSIFLHIDDITFGNLEVRKRDLPAIRPNKWQLLNNGYLHSRSRLIDDPRLDLNAKGLLGRPNGTYADSLSLASGFLLENWVVGIEYYHSALVHYRIERDKLCLLSRYEWFGAFNAGSNWRRNFYMLLNVTDGTCCCLSNNPNYPGGHRMAYGGFREEGQGQIDVVKNRIAVEPKICGGMILDVLPLECPRITLTGDCLLYYKTSDGGSTRLIGLNRSNGIG